MARDLSLLASPAPAAAVPAEVTISHVQLRDLIICPKEAGVVNYVQRNRIVEHNLKKPNTAPRIVADLDFTPNTLTSLRVGPSGGDVLIAAGGQNADIHLSYHAAGPSIKRRPLKNVWSIDGKVSGSINNSVALTTATSPSLALGQSHESSIEPRIGVSNNDCTVRFYDIPLRGPTLKRVRRNAEELHESGILRLDVPINHSSISPDGQSLLSVGDSNKVYIHSFRGGASISFSHIVTYSLPPPDYSAIPSPSGSLVASFSTAFSGDGLKFAVASQEGVVAVWDIRSSKPLKVVHTEKTRAPGVSSIIGNGHASGWISDDPWDWTRGGSGAPGWSVRNVKFGGSHGKEVLTFTEHTSLVHVIDARTFETHEIVQPANSQTSRYTCYTNARSVLTTSCEFSIASDIKYPTTFILFFPVALALPKAQFGCKSYREEADEREGGAPMLRWGSDLDDIVVIPPLGDTDVESEVHALLEIHGLTPRRASAALNHDRENDDEDDGEPGDDEARDDDAWRRRRAAASQGDPRMDVEEPESNCTSRSGSPMPTPVFASNRSSRASHVPYASPPPHGWTPATGPNRIRATAREDDDEDDMMEDLAAGRAEDKDLLYDPDLDLAGMCFDTTGQSLYVASSKSIVEWRVKGADLGRMWWASGEWR
ncbi:hypothetical protein EST38_g9430 [Candolleomyces aberdarensis]|uniref:DUF2415 domain-containing protein n=1 Tax=Candolleomyces aberdarensis TaxID=2316362 RepID=A0A4Q2DD69_9AGAR|nr:hypothetical protein EST38_g9430 [Candolleomyces aberdarensis]